MIIATEKDRETAIGILTSAFDSNKSVNYIVKQGTDREKHIRALMAYSFDLCYLFGGVWLSEEENACLLYLYPDRKRSNLKTIWFDLKLIFQSVGLAGIPKALKHEKLIAERQLTGKTLYLWFIGVTPTGQKKGLGTQLVKKLIELANLEGRTVTLETSTPRNLRWYESLGFTAYADLDLGYHLHFLKKEPD